MTATHLLLPTTSTSVRGGGQLAAVRLAACLSERGHPVDIVTYQELCPGAAFLADMMIDPAYDRDLFVLLWGPHVPWSLTTLGTRRKLYWAHSTGYPFVVPPDVAVVGVSQHSADYWAERGANVLGVLPNVLDDEWFAAMPPSRDIDVLTFHRKSDERLRCVADECEAAGLKVERVKDWVPSVRELYDRSKVLLYDATDHWTHAGVSEGFGLHIAEAFARGCVVHTTPLDAIAELLVPNRWTHYGRGTISDDVAAVAQASRHWCLPSEQPMTRLSGDAVEQAWLTLQDQL